MIAMCTETADQSKNAEMLLYFLNSMFLFIFAVECLMKMAALKWRYFTISWNIFDLIVVVLSILGKEVFFLKNLYEKQS